MSAYSQQRSNINKTWILIFLFISGVSALCYLLAYVNDAPWLIIVGLFVSIGQAVVGYFFGDKIALNAAGGREISETDAPKIHEMVYNLSKIAGIPKPKIYISNDPSPNAFAAGRDPEHASMCLNKGLLDILNKAELEGVIAHELSHIKNRDILVMTMTMVLASLVSFIADIGFRMFFWGGAGRDRNNNRERSPLILILYVVVIMLAPVVAALIQMAVSRQREYLADASAVTMTRYPEGLISALQKLYNNPVASKHYSTSTNHFYISPPKQEFGKLSANVFSTHPSIEDRVEALRRM